MKTLIVNAVYSQGGAARAALRLHRGLLDRGADSSYLTNYADTTDPVVLATRSQLRKKINSIRYFGDQLPLLFYPRKNSMFSPNFFPSDTLRRINQVNADIVHLNWINNGFLNIESVHKIQAPIVWTLHDSWVFTGGCHLPHDCKNYEVSCGKCPVLGSNTEADLSSRVLARKRKSWKNFTVVTPSRWLRDCAQKSSLFRDFKIEVIPHGLNIQMWRPIDKNEARQQLFLPKDKKLVLMLAKNVLDYRYKGIDLLQKAISLMDDNLKKDIVLVIVGADCPHADLGFSCQTIWKGQIDNDEVLRSIYSAVDVTAFPSFPEALGFVAMESMACATPVVAFDTGGVIDIIEHKRNGYLAPSYSESGFAEGLTWLLKNTEVCEELGREARKTIEQKFDIRLMVDRYLELYKEILNG